MIVNNWRRIHSIWSVHLQVYVAYTKVSSIYSRSTARVLADLLEMNTRKHYTDTNDIFNLFFYPRILMIIKYHISLIRYRIYMCIWRKMLQCIYLCLGPD